MTPPIPFNIKKIIDDIYSFAGSILESFDLEASLAGENLPKFEFTVYYVRLFDGQMRCNGADLWITNGYAGHTTCDVLKALDELGTDSARQAREIVEALKNLKPTREALEDDWSNATLKQQIVDRERDLESAYSELRPPLMADLQSYVSGHPERDRCRDEDALWARVRKPEGPFMPRLSKALAVITDLEEPFDELLGDAEKAGAKEEAEYLFDLFDKILDIRNEIADAAKQDRWGREF